MAFTIQEIREKYPEYNDMSDMELADALHSKFYPDLPKSSVYEKIGLAQSDNPSTELNEEKYIPAEKTGLAGVGSDFAKGLANALSGAKKFAVDVPENLEKSGQYIEKNPGKAQLHMLGQIGAESANIGKNILNSAYNLNQYLARKHLIPQVLGKLGKALPHIPEDTGVEKALGLEADPEKGDALFRAIPDVASLAIGTKTGLKAAKQPFKSPDLKQVVRDTQAKVNEARSNSGKIFDFVENEVENRGIPQIPVESEIIKQAQRFLAKTPANKALIKKARTGDYKSLRALQADLRVKGEKALSSKLAAENIRGEEILATRDQLNGQIQHFFEENGHKDLGNALNQARKQYKEIQDVYFSTPSLAKVFGKSQRVPKDPARLLTEETTEMKRFMLNHPEVEAALKKALKHKGKMDTLKKLGGIVGIGGSAELARELFFKRN